VSLWGISRVEPFFRVYAFELFWGFMTHAAGRMILSIDGKKFQEITRQILAGI